MNAKSGQKGSGFNATCRVQHHGYFKKSNIHDTNKLPVSLKLDLYFCSHCGAVGFKCIIICPTYLYQASQFTS